MRATPEVSGAGLNGEAVVWLSAWLVDEDFLQPPISTATRQQRHKNPKPEGRNPKEIRGPKSEPSHGECLFFHIRTAGYVQKDRAVRKNGKGMRKRRITTCPLPLLPLK